MEGWEEEGDDEVVGLGEGVIWMVMQPPESAVRVTF